MSAPPFSFTVRRSQKSRRIRIIVTLSQVEVVAPPQVPDPLIEQFIASKQAWVLQALEKVAANHRQQTAQAVFYRQDQEITYRGAAYPITLKTTPAKRLKIEFSDGFTVHAPQTLMPELKQEAVKKALAAWLKQQAKRQVADLVAEHGGKHGLMPRSISIKSQKSRWGSCGIHNDIHINWLLMAAPPAVLEYVVVHELCHVRIKNHSADFWALVAAHLPDYQQQRLWLKQHGAGLMKSWL